MARRRGGVRRFVGKARGYASRAGLGSVVAGVVGGALAPMAENIVPGFGAAIGYVGAGMLMHNETLKTIGGVALGAKLGAGIGGGSVSNGGAW